MRLRPVLAVSTAALLLAPPAFAAAPVKGGRYTGTTSQGQAVSARVTSDGKTLQLRYRQKSPCSDGSSISFTEVYRRQAPRIRADGSFDYSKRYSNGKVDGFPNGYTIQQHVTGSFSDGGKRATVRASDVTAGKGDGARRCSATVTFTLRLKT